MGYDLIARLLHRYGVGERAADIYAYKNRSIVHEYVPPKIDGET